MKSKSQLIMKMMVEAAEVHGLESGVYRNLKKDWFIAVDQEYTHLRAVTNREQREKLLDGDYERKIEALKEISGQMRSMPEKDSGFSGGVA